MTFVTRRLALQLLPLFLLMTVAQSVLAAPVLMISIDGLKPEYVTEADAKGLRIPFLRAMLRDGTYAEGVTGVWPTVTYPSHTTLLTGISPAEHGIYNNMEFDPLQSYLGAWYWFAPEIRVPTLWQAAHQAGLRTASVGWPVSVGAAGVDWLIPEYWRATGPTETLNPSERELLAAISRPDGLIEQLQPAAGPYMMGDDCSIGGDEIKTRYSVEILRRQKPEFMTIHLSALDETEHEHGPFSAEANRDLEAIDGMVSRLAATALANDPATVVTVVSDHGFVALTHSVNFYIPFLQAGLIQATIEPGKTPVIHSWKAQPWLAGGMAAILLRDANDHQTEQQVSELLQKLAADKNSGIVKILDREAIKATGGFPNAAFLVVLQPGYLTGSATSGSFVNAIPDEHGGHGFSPEFPDMRASFFISGAGIAHHRDLGVIDMRQIAPTAAKILKVQLPAAKAEPLHVQP